MKTHIYGDGQETDETLRPLLFSIAYRMLGAVGDSEDLVQETLLRLHTSTQQGVDIQSPKAYASAIVTRLSIDHLRSSRVKRESYVGEWLPEPLLAEPRSDPGEQAEIADSLSMALLVVLESLSPPERAVFLLRDVFDFGFDEIAEMIGKTAINTRQIAVRARKAIKARRPRFDASQRLKWELATRFFSAVNDGDTDALVDLLAADATMYGDGGGRTPSRRQPTTTAPRVAAFLASLSRRSKTQGLSVALKEVNGQPGALITTPDDTVNAVMSLDIYDNKIQTIRVVLNPDKLRHLRP